MQYTSLDAAGHYLAISGRFGLAFYSVPDRKWKLFGNEAQERDFVVVGGMLWWRKYLVVAIYDLAKDVDEIRFYNRDAKLDTRSAMAKRLPSQILSLSMDGEKILAFCADCTLAVFQIDVEAIQSGDTGDANNVGTFLPSFFRSKARINLILAVGVTLPFNAQIMLLFYYLICFVLSLDPLTCLQTIDITALCVHPACVISVYLTTLKPCSPGQHSVVINVSGRLMILHHEFLVQGNKERGNNAPQYITPTVLASCVEMVWLPRKHSTRENAPTYNPYLSEALWLYCGQEMRVWLPLKDKEQQSSIHTFISNRIMLGFPVVGIYPLSMCFIYTLLLQELFITYFELFFMAAVESFESTLNY